MQKTNKRSIYLILPVFILAAIICLLPIWGPKGLSPSIEPTFSNTPTGQTAPSFAGGTSLSDMAEAYLGAVATVKVFQTNLDTQISFGSGVAIADGGYLVTNFHVISNVATDPIRYSIKLTMTVNGILTEDVPAALLWYNANLDLAVLQSQQNFDCFVDMSDRWINPAPNNKLRIAEEVWTLGTPADQNLWGSFSKGTISSNMFRVTTMEVATETIITQSNIIQHNAAISSGSSGSGLFDANGKLVAINCGGQNSTSSSSVNDIFFAIPIHPITLVIDKIIEANEDENPLTNYRLPKLGVSAFDQNSYTLQANQISFSADGMLIVNIENNSPLLAKNIFVGDVIVGVGNENCTGPTDPSYHKINLCHDLTYALMHYNPGDKITLYFQAGTQTFDAVIQLL